MPSMKTELKMLFAVLLMTVCLLARAEEQAAYDMANPGNLLSGHLYAESALLIDEDSGETLFSKNSKIRMYPASTTKIMTLMLALESDVPLDAEVTIPREAARIEEGSSVVPVYPGDVMSFSDLLYGFMLSSGNDGANAIAVLVDGNIDAFVENMNRRASELGCQGTHYVNPHGYHDPEHYTTASDLAIIARAAMRDPEFRKIVAAPDWTMHIRRNGSTVETRIISRNTLLQSGEKYYYPACTGIKTGHHNKAGWCFVGSAQREGMRLICVVLNCREEMSKWYDAARLFEYGFTRYEPVTLGALLEALERRQGDIEIENADPNDAQGGRLSLDMGPVSGGEQTLPLVADSTASYENALQRLSESLQITWERGREAPVSAGERMATISLQVDGLEPVSAVLTASRDVAVKPAATRAPAATAPAAEETEPPSSEPSPAGSSAKTSGAFRLVLMGAGALLILALAVLIGVMRHDRLRRKKRRGSARSGSRRRGSGRSASPEERPLPRRR